MYYAAWMSHLGPLTMISTWDYPFNPTVKTSRCCISLTACFYNNGLASPFEVPVSLITAAQQTVHGAG